MILAIVGSRGGWSLETEALAINVIKHSLRFLEPTRIVSGGCPKGVDQWAIDEAHWQNVPFDTFLPNNQRWEPDGFKARNVGIAKACDRLVSIRSTRSMTYGAGWTADYAESIGKKVYRFAL